MTTRIIFNGKEYASVEAMPEGVRRLYEAAMQQLADKDRDGVPDVLERGGIANKFFTIQHTSITVDGKTYGSVEEMPADVRRVYEEAMEKLDANRDGIPDPLQGGASNAGEGTSSVVVERFHLGRMREGGHPGLVVESGVRSLLLVALLIAVLVLLFWWL